MKRMLKITILIVTVTCGTGCTTGYWTDRGRDAADIFTVTAGVGGGVFGRIGPISTGIGVSTDYYGLQGGHFGIGAEDLGWEMSAIVFSVTQGNGHEICKERGKDYGAFYMGGVAVPGVKDAVDPRFPPHFFTQIEVMIGLGGTVKLGFNPGELLDFLLGFIGVDMYDDDLKQRKKRRLQQEGRPSGLP